MAGKVGKGGEGGIRGLVVGGGESWEPQGSNKEMPMSPILSVNNGKA